MAPSFSLASCRFNFLWTCRELETYICTLVLYTGTPVYFRSAIFFSSPFTISSCLWCSFLIDSVKSKPFSCKTPLQDGELAIFSTTLALFRGECGNALFRGECGNADFAWRTARFSVEGELKGDFAIEAEELFSPWSDRLCNLTRNLQFGTLWTLFLHFTFFTFFCCTASVLLNLFFFFDSRFWAAMVCADEVPTWVFSPFIFYRYLLISSFFSLAFICFLGWSSISTRFRYRNCFIRSFTFSW